jgi:HPt (histidine-containing phosphotransfer) domain-containing protein
MPASMSEALGRLWAKFLPEIEKRTAILEAAVTAIKSASLSEEEREAAHQAAHKLAGVLGTFGLQRGTELARQAELAFAEEQPAHASELSAWVGELRSLIDSRK